MDLCALRQTNADVLGWIHIPDTPISYPLLQAEDNQTYLNKTWDGANNSAGSIYLECKNEPDFSNFNTLIYGHRMKNGSMFGSLGNYSQQEYFSEHPYVYIITDDSVLQYEIFSAYEAPVVSDTYRLHVEDEETKQAVLEYSIASSVLKSAQVPTTADSILTLSTCTGTGTYHSRWVVQAVLTDRWSR
jgi:sortase B